MNGIVHTGMLSINFVSYLLPLSVVIFISKWHGLTCIGRICKHIKHKRVLCSSTEISIRLRLSHSINLTDLLPTVIEEVIEQLCEVQESGIL